MADTNSRASVIARSSSFLNRPNQAPMGPRTRNRSSHQPQSDQTSAMTPPRAKSPPIVLRETPLPRPLSTTPNNPPYLPEFGPPVAAVENAALTTINEGADDPSPIQSPAEPEPTPSPPAFSDSPTVDAHDAPAHGPNHDDATASEDPQSDAEPTGVEEPVEQQKQPALEVLAEEPEVAVEDEDTASRDHAAASVDSPAEEPLPESTDADKVSSEGDGEDETTDSPSQDEPQPESTGTTEQSPPLPVPAEVQSRAASPLPVLEVKSRAASPLPVPSRTATPQPVAATPAPPKPIANPPKLTPPPAIKFDSVPVQWKGLPLDAAVWTFDSKELQAIVSRAIRSSAKESYIRLLAIDILDNVLPAEVERLEAQKSTTQAKYRFLVHRRTMQLQALLSSSLAPRSAKETEEGILTASKLIVQISETAAECDQLMETLLKITDQLGQIKRLLDHHWASALAIALRKLNGSYARRTADLANAKERIAQLQAELEDAWAEAEKLANEMDDLDAGLSDEELQEAVIETAEIVSVKQGPDSRPMSPAAILTLTSSSQLITEGHRRIDSGSQISPTSDNSQHQAQPKRSPVETSFLQPLSPVLPLMIRSGVPKRYSEGIVAPVDVPDSVSVKSSRSNKSAKSYKSTSREGTRASIVSAAKTRSIRASESSLRLPPNFASLGSPPLSGHKRSNSRPKTPYDTTDQPPVPDLPLRFTPSHIHSQSTTTNSSSMLRFGVDTLNATDAGSWISRSGFSNGHSRRISLDSSRMTNGHHTPLPWIGGAMDDMYIKSPPPADMAVNAVASSYSVSSRGLHDHDRDVDEHGIQIVPRTPPMAMPKVMSMEEYAARPRLVPRRRGDNHGEGGPGQSIPSMWMNVDGTKGSEREETLVRQSSKGKAYERLRGLTKRYSLTLPLFSRANNSQGNLNSAGRPNSGSQRSS